jgi:hypothetical protein
VTGADEFADGAGGTGTLTPTSSESGPLEPGESRTFTATGVAVEGKYHNTATASAPAVDGDGEPLAAQPEAATDGSWCLAGEVGLTVVKLTNGEDVGSARARFSSPTAT